MVFSLKAAKHSGMVDKNKCWTFALLTLGKRDHHGQIACESFGSFSPGLYY